MKEYSIYNDSCYINTIYYISIGDLINRRIIIDYFSQGKIQQNLYKKKTKEIIDKLILIQITPGERFKETFDFNKKLITYTDSKAQISFMIVINDNYPERYCYELLENLEKKSSPIITKHYINKRIEDKESLENSFKNFAKDIQLYMVELERKYRDIVSKDKIRLIQHDVDDIKINVKNNIDKMLTNIELVSNLEDKSEALKDMAKDFKRNANQVKRRTLWGRRKYSMLAGGVGLTGILYFGFKFFLK